MISPLDDNIIMSFCSSKNNIPVVVALLVKTIGTTMTVVTTHIPIMIPKIIKTIDLNVKGTDNLYKELITDTNFLLIFVEQVTSCGKSSDIFRCFCFFHK